MIQGYFGSNEDLFFEVENSAIGGGYAVRSFDIGSKLRALQILLVTLGFERSHLIESLPEKVSCYKARQLSW